MNRVKAGDAWARVSTKRYGSRLDGNEARIETLLPSPSFHRSLPHVSASLLHAVTGGVLVQRGPVHGSLSRGV